MSVSGLVGAKFWGKNFFDSAEQASSSAPRPETSRSTATMCRLTRSPSWSKVAGEPIWNEWVKKMEGKGHKDAREVLNTALDC